MQIARKHDLKAEFLLDKGIPLLWSKGYTATSVSDLVNEAQIPKGSFYFYFESKEDFVAKAIERYFAVQFKPAHEILTNKSLSPKQRLIDFYAFRYDFLSNELNYKMGCMACNLGNEMAEHSELIRSTILDKHQQVLALISEIIEEAQRCGEISRTLKADDIAAFIEDASKGAMITMKVMKSSYPIDNLMNTINNLLLK